MIHETFIIGTPRPQGSMQLSRDPRSGKEFVKYSSPTMEWRRVCHVALGEWWDNAPALQGPVEVHYEFVMPRPKAHLSAKGGLKASAPHWHWGTTNDLDKLCRCINDALTNAGIWGDDGQVAIMHAHKRWADVDELPGVQIRIEKLGGES